MKIKLLLIMLLFFAGLLACKEDKESAPETLDIATNDVRLSLDSLNNSLASASTLLASVSADTTAIRTKLQELFATSSFAKEMAFISPQGMAQIIEPPAYYQYQGIDFSHDTTLMDLIQTHQSVFTNFFIAIEGYDAVADIHPVYDGTTSFGAIEALFTPYDLLNRIIAPLVSPPYEIWVMELSGTVIFDPDLTTTGLNVFTDPYYDPFPDFKTACQTIVQGESGQVTYTFYLTGTNTPMEKNAWWNTIHLHNNAWKIVWTQQK